MAISSRTMLACLILILLSSISLAQTCRNYTFTSKTIFDCCSNLPSLGANIHWNYSRSSDRVAIAYRAAQTPDGWVAWAINPTARGMIGSQALVAFHHSNGSMIAYSTPITSYNPSMQPGDLSFQVTNIAAEYANNEMIIYAVVGPLGNKTTVNHVWQAGNSATSDIPQIHSMSTPNLQSMGTVDFLAG